MAQPTVKGSGTAVAGSAITLPAHAAGDLIVLFAYRDGATAVPTKPGAAGTVPAWSDIDAGTGANTNSMRSASVIATANNHTSGTWTNATGMAVVVYSAGTFNAYTPVGAHNQSGSTGNATTVAPAFTGTPVTDGNSAFLQFVGHRNVTAWSAVTSGWSRLASVATECALQTKTDTTSDGTMTQACSTSATGGYRGDTVEILPYLAPNTGPVARIGLAAASTPATRTLHSLHIVARVQTAVYATVKAALYEGATNRSGDLESATLSTTLAEYSLPIADASAANISSYASLELRIWGYSASGAAPVLEIADAWLEIPAAAAGGVTLACAAASATASGGNMALGVTPLLQCAASSPQATGQSLGLTVTPVLQCAASSAQASGRNVLLAQWLNASSATATGQNVTVTTLTAGVLACAAATGTATGQNVGLVVTPLLQCAAASGQASAGNVLLAQWLNPSSSTATGQNVGLVVRPLLQCAANSAAASTRNVLLAQWFNPATATATTDVLGLETPPVIVEAAVIAAPAAAVCTTSCTLTIGGANLTCAASSSTATGQNVALIVRPLLPCAAAAATGTGRNVLLAQWLNPATSTATGQNITLAPTVAVLPCTANSATATGQNVALIVTPLLQCAAGAAQAAGQNITLTVLAVGVLPCAASAATATGTVALIVRPILPCAAATATSSGATFTLTTAIVLGAAASTATAGGTLTLVVPGQVVLTLAPSSSLATGSIILTYPTVRQLGAIVVTTAAVAHLTALTRTRGLGTTTARGHFTLEPLALAHTRAQGKPILSARIDLNTRGLAHTRTLGSPEINLPVIIIPALSRV